MKTDGSPLKHRSKDASDTKISITGYFFPIKPQFTHRVADSTTMTAGQTDGERTLTRYPDPDSKRKKPRSKRTAGSRPPLQPIQIVLPTRCGVRNHFQYG